MEKQCVFCDKKFKPKVHNAKYCSVSCRKKADYSRNKEGYIKRAIKSRPKQAAKRREANKSKWFGVCLECGVDYKKSSQSQKYCSNSCQRKFLYRKNTLNGKESLWRKKAYENQKDKWIKKQTAYTTQKRKEDPLWNLSHRLRVRLHLIFKNKDWEKKENTFDLVGCDSQTLKKHLEQKFLKDMSWENKGEWHIDHIIPLSSAKTEEELIMLCHYKNLQPLWAKDNLKKSNKIL